MEGVGVVDPGVQILGGDTVRVEARRTTIEEQEKVRAALASYANAAPSRRQHQRRRADLG